jgi:hypothetical protein
MDRPFEGSHKSFTVQHAGDEPAMKDWLEGTTSATGADGRSKLSGIAQKSFIPLIFCKKRAK